MTEFEIRDVVSLKKAHPCGSHRCRRSGEEEFAPSFQTVYRLLQGHLESR